MGKNNIINELLFHLNEIKEGIYADLRNMLKKTENNCGFEVKSFINSQTYNIGYYYNESYTICKKIDNKSQIYITCDITGRTNKFICTEIDNSVYNIYEYGVSKDNDKMCLIRNNELLKQLDENTYIGYDSINDKTYVYFKKYNILKDSDNLNIDYATKEYNEYLTDEVKNFNNKLKKSLNSFKNSLLFNGLKGLANTLEVRMLNENFESEIEELKKLSAIYNNYKDNFNLSNYEDDFNNIIDFTNKVLDYSKKNNIKKKTK